MRGAKHKEWRFYLLAAIVIFVTFYIIKLINYMFAH